MKAKSEKSFLKKLFGNAKEKFADLFTRNKNTLNYQQVIIQSSTTVSRHKKISGFDENEWTLKLPITEEDLEGIAKTADRKPFAVTKDKIIAHANRIRAKFNLSIDQPLAAQKAFKSEIEDELSTSSEVRHQRHLDSFTSENKEAAKNREKKAKEQLFKIENELETKNNEHNARSNRHDEFKQKNNTELPTPSFLNNNKVYFTILAALCFAEIGLNYMILSILEAIWPLFLIPIAITISLGSGLCAHFLGKALSDREKNKDMMRMSAVGLGTILFALIVARLMAGAGGLFVICLLIALAAAGVLTAYVRSITHDACHNFAEMNRLSGEIKQLGAEREDIEKALKSLGMTEESDNDAKAQQLSQKEVFELEKQFKTCEMALTRLEAFKLGYHNALDAIEKDALAIARGRSSDGDQDPTFPGGVAASLATILACSLMFLNVSCTQPPTTVEGIMLDKTIQYGGDTPPALQPLSTKAVMAKVQGRSIENMEEGQYDFVLVEIGDNSVPSIEIAHQDQISHILIEARKTRLENQAKLNERISSIIYNSVQKPTGLDQTFFFSALIKANQEMAKTTADQSKLTCFTDGLENNEVFSFYRYKKNPDAISEEAETIISLLEENFAFGEKPRFEGMQIEFVYSPAPKNEALYRAARNFWRYYIESRGGKVTFSAAKTISLASAR